MSNQVTDTRDSDNVRSSNGGNEMFPQVHMCESCLKQGKFVAVDPARVKAGFGTCLPCGERVAKAKKWCTATLHKSNTIVITDYEDLKGINNKGGFYR